MLSLSPKGFKPREGGREEAAGQSPPAVTALRVCGQARHLLLESGQEPEVRGACPQRSRASPGQGRAGVTFCRPQAPELFSTLYHPSVTSWPQSRGHSCYTLSLPEAPQPLAPTRGPALHCLAQGGSGKAEAYGGTQRVGGSTESGLHPPSCLSHTLLHVTSGETEAQSRLPLTEVPEPKKDRVQDSSQAWGSAQTPLPCLRGSWSLGNTGRWGRWGGRPPGAEPAQAEAPRRGKRPGREGVVLPRCRGKGTSHRKSSLCAHGTELPQVYEVTPSL